MKQWLVPYRRVCHGDALVEAETAAEAEALVDGGGFDPTPGEEMVDWGVQGSAKEEK